ncbi:MAG TPA: carboxypeptidase regulatory-like domain-containing protein [Acidobacteriaceae bacterium]
MNCSWIIATVPHDEMGSKTTSGSALWQPRAGLWSVVLCFFLLCPGLARAQLNTADIVGTVTDAGGAIIPNATVKIENLGTHETRTSTTGAGGDYVVNLLNPGSYSVTISAPGFKAFFAPSLAVVAGDRARIDAKLEIGAATETVRVSSTGPALQTDSSVLTSTINDRATQNLPLNGRNYINLAQLTPGANEGPPNGLTSGARPDDRRQTSSISVNGQSDIVNNEMVDGLDNNERIIGTIGIRPSIEAIQEIRVQSNSYTAEVGRTAGGVVNIITKSGTNQFHGSAYEYFRNDVLDASPFQFGAHNRKPVLRQNQFGGSFGGPIIKDRTFFFADYEGLRQVQGGNPVQLTVPTLAQEQNPSSLLPAGATLSPAGLAYFKLYPAPNAPSPDAATGRFVGSPKNTLKSDTYDIRVDHRFRPNDLFFGKFSYNDVPTTLPGILPIVNVNGVNVAPGGAIYNYYGSAEDKALSAQLNYIHTFTSSLLLELKFGYLRINNSSFPLNSGTAVNTAFGQPNVNLNQLTSGLAPTSVNGYADLGDGAFIPILDIDNTFQYMGAVTWTKGAHNIKIGAGLIRRQALNNQNNYGTGLWNFQSATVPAGATPNPTTALTNLLTGSFYSVQRNNQITPPHYRVWEPSFYIQDDWRATNKLTLNLGVRYDIFTPFSEVHNAISTFDPRTARILVAGQNGVNQYAGLNPTWTNVAPRIGFAYSVAPGTVVRGGFGISYFPENYTSNSSLKNQPFVSVFGTCGPTIGACPGGFTNFSQGLPLPAPASATNPSGAIPNAVDPAYRSSYLEQFNLTVEHDFSGNVVQVSYVGMLGRHLAQVYNDVNAPPPNTLADPNTLRPFIAQLPNVRQIGGYKSGGSSSYNSLQVSLTRRLQHGLTVGANYTYAHGLDDVIDLSNEINDGYGAVPSQINTLDYGNSDLDIRNRGVVQGVYDLPFGKNLTGPAAIFGKGWQASTILVWSNGMPYTIVNSTSVSNTNPGEGSDRPNQLHAATVGNPTIARYFDTGAFATQTPGALGSERKNPLYGPPYRHLDLALAKTVPIHENINLQFRAESFNLTNVTNFATPNHTIGQSNFGTITSASPNYVPREFQFVLKVQF